MASPTPNKGYTYPAHGGAVNSWDTPLNENFDAIDLNLGGTYDVTITSTATTVTYGSSVATVSSTASTITFPSSIAANLYYNVTGVMTRNLTIEFPAAGGYYIVNNETTGAFEIVAETASATSSGVTVEQGGTASVVSDGTDVRNTNTAHDAKFDTHLGDPNGSVDGRAGAIDGSLTDVTWDATNQQLYVCTTSGAAADAVWTPQIARLTPQGILTVRDSVNFPPLNVNTNSATVIYYAPYTGNWTLLSNGTILYPYQFSRFTLTLTAAAHLTGNIYDIFMYANPTAGIISPVIGTGPSWSAGTSGSIAAGSCARGSGAGGTAISRFQGILTNSTQVTLTNNLSTYICPANQGIYLGSIMIGNTSGAVACHMSAGQDRRWGVWNAYNRMPIRLCVTSPVGSWTLGSGSWRRSNADSDNRANIFCGLAEEGVFATFTQNIQRSAGTPEGFIGITPNSITDTPSQMHGGSRMPAAGTFGVCLSAQMYYQPTLGFSYLQCMEKATATVEFFGDEEMQMTATYNG